MAKLPHKMPRKDLFDFMICFLSLIPIIEGADPTFLFLECPKATLSTTSTYAPNSTYQTNLNTLLSVISSNSNASNGFYNFTAGSSPLDVAYGLFLCRGDISATACRHCIAHAAGDVVERCPRSKRAGIWYDECMLRYSNMSIFSTLDTSFRGVLINPQIVTNATRFREVLGEVIDDISARAASSDDSGKKFATAKVKYTPLRPVYGLAQCTPDLSNSDCNKCLQTCISIFRSCCDANNGARVMFPSCNVRFETYPFYNTSFGAAPPPPSPIVLPPPPRSCTTTSSPGKGGVSSQVIIAIVVLMGVSIMLLVVGFCFVTMRAKKKYNASIKEVNDNEQGKLLKGIESDQSISKSMTWSVNEALIIELEPR